MATGVEINQNQEHFSGIENINNMKQFAIGTKIFIRGWFHEMYQCLDISIVKINISPLFINIHLRRFTKL